MSYYYVDITKDFIKNTKRKNYKVSERNYYIKDGKKYNVDNKNVVLDYSKEEYELAVWLSNTFKENVKLNPRINKPEGVKTADYIFKGEKWDLKNIKGKSKQVIYHAIKNSKNQSNNFIIDITKCNFTLKEGKIMVETLYQRDDTIFLKKIILKKDENFIAIKRM